MSAKRPLPPQRPTRDSRRGGALAVLVLVALVLGWMALNAGSGRGGDSSERGSGHELGDERGDGEPGSREGRRARAGGPLEDGGVLRTRAEEMEDLALKQQPPVERAIEGFQPEPGEYDPGPGRDYMERYQGRSGALSPNTRPGQGDVTTPVQSTGEAPLLTAWVPTIRVQAGQPAVISAQLLDSRDQRVTDAEVVISIGHPGQAPEVMVTMAAVDAADHMFEHTFITPTTRAEGTDPNVPLQYDYRVQAVGTFQGQQFSRIATGSFGVHASPGAIDPETLRVERDGGDLVVRFTVAVERDATFWGYADLWGGDSAGVPIAFARDQFPGMTAGRHDVTLRFGGAIIRDTGADGPFVVRNVKWMQVDAVPPQETDPILELPPTPAWRADEFQ